MTTMKTTHTPGPWSHASGQETIWANDGSLLVARTDYTRHDMAVNEDEANARLIAAAPSMLTQLDTCPVIRLGESLEDFKPRFQAWHRETSALLATLSP